MHGEECYIQTFARSIRFCRLYLSNSCLPSITFSLSHLKIVSFPKSTHLFLDLGPALSSVVINPAFLCCANVFERHHDYDFRSVWQRRDADVLSPPDPATIGAPRLRNTPSRFRFVLYNCTGNDDEYVYYFSKTTGFLCWQT